MHDLAERAARNNAAEAIKDVVARQGDQYNFSQNNFAHYTDLMISTDWGVDLDELSLQAITVKYRVQMEVSCNIVIDKRWRIRMRSGEPAVRYCHASKHSLAFSPNNSGNRTW